MGSSLPGSRVLASPLPVMFSPAIYARAYARASAIRGVPARMLRFYSNKLSRSSPVTEYGADPVVRYTTNHEWIAAHKDNVAFVGITKYAADALGDTTYVEVVEPATEAAAEESIGSVESVKSASDLYSPVTGTVVEANQAVVDNPSLVNEDPMGRAWFAKIELKDPTQLDKLLTYEQYEKFLKEEGH